LAQEAAHEFVLKLPDQPIVLDADAVRLAQVFGNIFTNAVKYSPKGSRTDVTVAIVGDVVEVSVRDHGIGIDPAQLPKVFEMFTRIDDSADRAPEGLGVGLPLAQSLVQLHGGTIEAKSNGRGRGSEFVIRLPLSQLFPDAGRPIQQADSDAPSRPRRILVVDDHVDAAESMAAMLQLQGHEVVVAHSGLKTLEVVESFEPDVVLLDIGLPGINGYEVARRLRATALGKNLLIIAMTGWGAEDDRKRSRDAGFNHHLTKPVEPESLIRLIQ
jgi:CheY-like chemotaxis protein